ncbi:nitrilase-related carbon-nitrogen hydrolase [Actinotalea sp.]|uniref:nitrilase-related carbon-nitrogen hydrolase n=1 Tax=Actinotalea sp. TaxID=1872145 RepID=UPI003564F88B
MSLRVAGLALRSTLDADANRAAAVRAVHEAADDGARLVVLPEYAACFDPRGVGPAQAEAPDGPFVQALAEVAAARSLVVLAGTVVAAEVPDRAVNLVVAVGPQGLLGSYRKVHLYDAFGQRESDRFVGGDPTVAPLVVPVDGIAVGVITCYDLRFPEAARRLIDAGAGLIVVPAAWAAGEGKADHWRTLLRARAIENTAYVLGVPMDGPGVTGDPILVDPAGRVLGEALGRGQRSVLGDVDPAVLAAVRAANPSLVNRRYRTVPRD